MAAASGAIPAITQVASLALSASQQNPTNPPSPYKSGGWDANTYKQLLGGVYGSNNPYGVYNYGDRLNTMLFDRSSISNYKTTDNMGNNSGGKGGYNG